MKINTWIKYTEGFLPTKRHRKIRYKECEEYVDIELREVTFKDVSKKYSVDDKIYYGYKNSLYIKANSKDISCFDIENPLDNLKYRNKNCSSYFGFESDDTKEKMISKANESMNQYLLIDNILYKRTYKPFYKLCVFGLGNNHGGTGLYVAEGSYLENGYCFKPKDREKAIEKAINIAVGRGDTNFVEHIKNISTIVEY